MKVISRLLKFVVTGSFTVLLAACYGTYQVMYGVPFYPIRIRTVSSTDTDVGIPEMKITLLENSKPLATDRTDEYGWADLEYTGMIVGELRVRVEDVDGAENGEYADTVVPLDTTEPSQTILVDEK